jgi:hypothetical protein
MNIIATFQSYTGNNPYFSVARHGFAPASWPRKFIRRFQQLFRFRAYKRNG